MRVRSLALGRVTTKRPKIRDVIRRLVEIKHSYYATRESFYRAWAEARALVYQTEEWGDFSVAVKTRSKGRCESCKRRPAVEIHHRRRVADFPHLVVTVSNGLHVCGECHMAAHPHLQKKVAQ